GCRGTHTQAVTAVDCPALAVWSNGEIEMRSRLDADSESRWRRPGLAPGNGIVTNVVRGPSARAIRGQSVLARHNRAGRPMDDGIDQLARVIPNGDDRAPFVRAAGDGGDVVVMR